ncbi:MAG: alpha-mannosidase [Oculatellaceae cyanobacterium Prado106]|nr:alpha-mannosidase [Oculatellaceae cyanobacterium Prado106]
MASDSITSAIAHLRSLTQISIQTQWHQYFGDLPTDTALQVKLWQGWAIAPLNDRHHIAWEKGKQVMWLGQRLQVPGDLQGYPLSGMLLRLSLTWWAEAATVYVNGQQVQEGDLFDHSARVLLGTAVTPGETIEIAIRLVSPGHDPGALVKSICVYERADQAVEPCPEPGFVADEWAVLQQYLTKFEPEFLVQLEEAIASLDWDRVRDRNAFDAGLAGVRRSLLPWGDRLKQRTIQLLGHAHLDLAWLWDIADTWDAAERTFRSVLQLQQDFLELTFGHSTPALYEWIEINRPELFAEIQAQVAAGRWEVIAGLWVEPELNLISGESLIRQVLYGQRYVQQKFGHLSRVAWLPDSFGFCWQLPQILRQGGVDYFVTQKLRWNDTTQFPHEVFWWRSPDRSQIFSLNSAPIGEGIDPVKMAQYAWDWEATTGSLVCLWLPGVGDHGGGPTRDMLEVARRWQRSPFFPQLQFGTAIDFLDDLRQQESKLKPLSSNSSLDTAKNTAGLPIWNEDLYLEFHRGCYTTHADQKLWNRTCENRLYEAEWYAAIAHLLTQKSYPKNELEQAWKNALFNQFHDILPGSAIAEVYRDANPLWIAALQTADTVLQKSLDAIATQIYFPSPPHPDAQAVIVMNALNWERSQIITLSLPAETGRNWKIQQMDGTPVKNQGWIQKDSSWEIQSECQLQFKAEAIPALGYRCYWLCPGSNPDSSIANDSKNQPGDLTQKWILENEFLQVTIDPTTGDLARVWDQVHQREVLSGAGNQLQAFRDEGQYWDAWNIDPQYADHPLPPAKLLQIGWGVRSPLETCIEVHRLIGQSTFVQTYRLQQGSPLLEIETRVDWQEKHVLVKAAFPLTMEADFATYEIPCGAIARTTKPESDFHKSQWESPALHWADLSNSDYGVSLLNTCKYGYDSQPNQLRITLLRGATWPNPEADRGEHHFSYALYPHAGSWQAAHTVQQGYALNRPLRVQVVSPQDSGNLPTVGQFLQLEADNLILTAFKQSEDDPEQWILRCYECQGESALLSLSNEPNLLLSACLDFSQAKAVDLLEREGESGGSALEQPVLGAIANPTDSLAHEIAPWKIVTFRIGKAKINRMVSKN